MRDQPGSRCLRVECVGLGFEVGLPGAEPLAGPALVEVAPDGVTWVVRPTLQC
jgi:hypothetical protein